MQNTSGVTRPVVGKHSTSVDNQQKMRASEDARTPMRASEDARTPNASAPLVGRSSGP